jgi:proline iminopeptidase
MTDEKIFKGWTCDELTPDLCDLSVNTGTFLIKGINVRYWMYYSSTTSRDRREKSRKSQKKLPVVVVHGGPAWPHYYLLPLKKLACDGRDVIFYDQAGCGDSTLPEANQSVQDVYPWLLDPNYYALQELPALLDHLAIYRFHLLGHSWGTILAQIYALDASTFERKRLVSMSLSGCISDLQLEVEQQWDPSTGNLGELPPFVQKRIHALEAAKAYDSPEYEVINDVLTTFFTCRTAPLPDCFLLSASKMNREIYLKMQGPSEFAIGGVLVNFNVTGRLHELSDLPVLLMSGRYDTVRPAVVEVMHQNLPMSERILFPRSGHVSAIDEAGPMNEAVADFLERVEAAGRDRFVPRLVKMPEPMLDATAEPVWMFTFSSGTSVLQIAVVAFILGTVFGAFWGPRSLSRSRVYQRIQ